MSGSDNIDIVTLDDKFPVRCPKCDSEDIETLRNSFELIIVKCRNCEFNFGVKE